MAARDDPAVGDQGAEIPADETEKHSGPAPEMMVLESCLDEVAAKPRYRQHKNNKTCQRDRAVRQFADRKFLLNLRLAFQS